MFSYRTLFFKGTRFCCCLPVRLGVIIMAFLGIIVSAVFSIALWYELSGRLLYFQSLSWLIFIWAYLVNARVTEGIKGAFIVGGIVETLLFAASVFG
jgi:hypothetical protein